MHISVIDKMIAAMINILSTPKKFTVLAAKIGAMAAPRLPPAAIKPKSLFD